MFHFQERKVGYDAMGEYRDKNISKAKEKKTALTGLQSKHGREGGKFF